MGQVKLRVEPGFLLFASLGFLLDGEGLFLPVALAWTLHELGHLLPLLLWGCSAQVHLTAWGAQIQPCSRGGLSYGKELMAVLLGPGVNLLCALLCANRGEGWYALAGIHLVLGTFNLLPLSGLDGGRAVGLLGSMLFEKTRKKEKLGLQKKQRCDKISRSE